MLVTFGGLGKSFAPFSPCLAVTFTTLGTMHPNARPYPTIADNHANRNDYPSGLTCVVACLMALLALVGNASAKRLNVVMILADDQSYRDFGFMGNDVVHTPNIDALARQSARYPNGYVPMSVCRPSLATLLTGLYPHQHGIHFNHPPPGLSAMRTMTAQQYRQCRARADYLIKNVPTLPRILARHGYACLQTGKHWEGDFRLAGFTHGMSHARPTKRVSAVTGTRLQDGGEPVAHGNGDAGLVIGRETMQPITEFLDAVAGKQPFFVWYAPFLPHTPFDAPQRFHDLYQDKTVPEHLRPYYAEIARFDETVGQLLDELAKRQLDQRTLVVFACDNGFRPDVQRHQRQNKRSKLTEYEDGLRTPILIRWNGTTRPADHSPLVGTVDLVPTILAAVGLEAEITPRMHGIDLMPSARAAARLPERPAFGAIYPNDATELGAPRKHVRGRWVRMKNYKLLLPGTAKPAIEKALYDLDIDPLETRNLIDDPTLQQIVEGMTKLANQWWTGANDDEVTE